MLIQTISEADLASRWAAARLRRQLVELLDGQDVELDLSAVKSISEGYADELFGVLVCSVGAELVFSRLKLIGASTPVLQSVTRAIRQRLQITGGAGAVDQALATAQRALAAATAN